MTVLEAELAESKGSLAKLTEESAGTQVRSLPCLPA